MLYRMPTGVHMTRLSPTAVGLLQEWQQALACVDDEDLFQAFTMFLSALDRNISCGTTPGELSVIREGHYTVALIDFPPFTELALREVVAAVRDDVGRLDQRIARIYQMTALLRGEEDTWR